MIKRLRILLHQLKATGFADRAADLQFELDQYRDAEQTKINQIAARAAFHETRAREIANRPGLGLKALIPPAKGN